MIDEEKAMKAFERALAGKPYVPGGIVTEAAKIDLCKHYNLPESMASRLKGSTIEELDADAEKLAHLLLDPIYSVIPQTSKTVPNLEKLEPVNEERAMKKFEEALEDQMQSSSRGWGQPDPWNPIDI